MQQPSNRDAAHERRRVLLFAAGVSAICAAASLHVGLLLDDLLSARWSAAAALVDVFTLRDSPFPFHTLLWKAAVAFDARNPQTGVHVFSALLHGANVFLVHRVLAVELGSRGAWVGAVAFAFFRPGNESILWASAESEVIMVFFSLLSLRSWQRGRERPAWFAWALVPMACAILAKPSACLLVVVLAAHWLWRCRGQEGVRVPAPWVPLAAGAALSAGLAFHAIGHDGRWSLRDHYAPERPPPAESVLNLGLGLGRLATQLAPTRALPPLVAGGLAFAAAGALLLGADRRIRIGVLWAGAFLSPPVLAAGAAEGRYLYGAAPGAVLVIGAAFSLGFERGGPVRGLACAAAGLWLLAGAGLYARDVGHYAGCGRVASEVRELLARRAPEVLAADRIEVAGRMRLVRPSDVLAYDFDRPYASQRVDRCRPGSRRPCLELRRSVPSAAACPSRAELPFVRWHPAAAGARLARHTLETP